MDTTLKTAQGGKLFISGYAEDAAVLVQLLGKQPGVHSARLASPAVRNGSTGQETFTIEIEFNASFWRILHIDYHRPLHTFEQTITAALSLYVFKTTL